MVGEREGGGVFMRGYLRKNTIFQMACMETWLDGRYNYFDRLEVLRSKPL